MGVICERHGQDTGEWRGILMCQRCADERPWDKDPRFVGPRSSAGLVQEEVADVPFRVAVASMLVGRSRGSAVRPILPALFDVIDTPRSDPATAAQFTKLNYDAPARIERILRPLGLSHVKTTRLLAFRDAWTDEAKVATAVPARIRDARDDRWHRPDPILPDPGWAAPVGRVAAMPGVGPYTRRCYEIFCLGRLGDEAPTDGHLARYWHEMRTHPEIYARGHVGAGVAAADVEGCDPEVGDRDP